MKLILTISVAILQAFIVIIPLKGKLSDNRRKFPYNFTFRGYILIICCLLTITCTTLIFIITDKVDEKSKQILFNQLRSSDSLHQQRIIESGNKYINKLDSSDKNTIELLAKYGLKYDSSQNIIAKLIKDSTKRNVTIVNGEDPVLMLCSGNGIKNAVFNGDTLSLNILLCSEKSTSKIKELNLTILSSNGTYTTSKNYDLALIRKSHKIQNKYSQIESNSSTEIETTYFHVLNQNMIYLRITGEYTNFDNTKHFPIDIIYGYDIKNKKFGTASIDQDEKIRKFLSN